MGIELFNEEFYTNLTFRVMLTQKCWDKPYEFIDNVGIELFNEELPTGVELYNGEIFTDSSSEVWRLKQLWSSWKYKIICIEPKKEGRLRKEYCWKVCDTKTSASIRKCPEMILGQIMA